MAHPPLRIASRTGRGLGAPNLGHRVFGVGTVQEVEVLSAWALGDATVARVEGGATNDTWRVATDVQVRFLRRYRTTDRSAVEREHDLIGRVADAAVGTPRLIPTSSDETVVELDGALFALFDEAGGAQLQPDDLTAAHATSAGALLAHVHIATADTDVNQFRHLMLEWNGPAWAERVRATAELIPRDSSRDVDRWARRRSLEQAAWLTDPDCRHMYSPTSPVQVIHGDFQHANLFFAETEAVAVIDWDTAVAGTRGFEIVRACWFMFHLDNHRTSAFLSGYRSVTPLSDAELSDGASAWGCYADHHVWATEERYRNGNRAAERFIPHRPFRPFGDLWGAVRLD